MILNLLNRKEHIIGAYVSGRLGNQMFQYAFAKAIKIAQGNSGFLVFNFGRVYRAGQKSDGFEDTLKYFNVEPYRTENGNLVLKYGSMHQKFVYLLYVASIKLFHANYNGERWLSFLRRVGLLYSNYGDHRFSIYKKYLNQSEKRKTLICYGKFENPEYFDSIKSILIEEFTPKLPPLNENKELYDIIQQKNSVCVVVRRGDYLSAEFKAQFYVCDEEYFQNAIEKMKVLIENPVFVFFSNDIDWVKKNIKIDLPAYYEPKENPVWESMRMMYNCKHFIISNGTFSWWGQYLSRNENKIVISPDHWYNNVDVDHTELLTDNFIRIPCKFT